MKSIQYPHYFIQVKEFPNRMACGQSTGFQPFLFKDVTNEDCFETLSFGCSTGNHRHYRTINKGLNFQAQCENQMCKSMEGGGCVYIRKGMYPDQGGYVSIRSEVFELKCPACGAEIPAENWKNIVFTDCTATIKWRLVDSCNGETLLVTESGMFTRAKPSV